MRALKCLLILTMFALPGAWAGEEVVGTHTRYYGSGANDNDVLFTTSDVAKYDACVLMSTTGAVDVFVSLDGTNYSTAALSLQDFGGTDVVPVLVTVAGRMYGFVGKVRRIKVLQNGATAAAASMNCWAMG